ncbi:DUF1566 domain-containing protein [Marinifilum caeruleilacunae]|nr:DUF1566 domain-containing protein [Marinifilum caeruleilacunae]
MRIMSSLIIGSLSLLMVGIGFSSCAEDDVTTSEENTSENTENLPSITGYPIVGTKQTLSYNNNIEISKPSVGEDFYGQNSNYPGKQPSYIDNGDGTITDQVTGLMWSQTTDLNGDGRIDNDDRMTLAEARNGASSFALAGYTDWRLPTIKEAYSLILFKGEDPSNYTGTSTNDLVAFIDTDYFHFNWGDVDNGSRIIDAQYLTTTEYIDYTMHGDETVFGVNFADGRIKGYPISIQGSEREYYVAYVRGNTSYGENNFVDNGNGTISDEATGLMWMQDDNGDEGLSWKEALEYAENKDFAGYTDWRLPDAKELQSIVDYTRSPETTNSAAIDALFNCSEIANENGETDFAYYWTSTTHATMATSSNSGSSAVYISFGRAMGYMNGSWLDVHGAGCQRSDPKMGNPDDYPEGHGPQGDARRIYNKVRLVRTK